VQAAIPVSSQYTPTLATLFPHPVSHNKKLVSPFQQPQEEKKNHGNIFTPFFFFFFFCSFVQFSGCHPCAIVLYLEYDPYTSFGPVLDSAKIASFQSQEEADFLAVTRHFLPSNVDFRITSSDFFFLFSLLFLGHLRRCCGRGVHAQYGAIRRGIAEGGQRLYSQVGFFFIFIFFFLHLPFLFLLYHC